MRNRCLWLCLVAVAFSTKGLAHYHADDPDYGSTANLISLLERGHHLGNNVDGVPADFECGWRKYALTYALSIQPWRASQISSVVWDALELTTLCNMTRPELQEGPSHLEWDLPKVQSYTVSNTEELTSALAQVAQKKLPATILLKSNTYRLSEPVRLGPEHSDLTMISENQSDPAIISGNLLLDNLEWKATAFNPNIFVAAVPQNLRVEALRVNGQRAIRARYPNANPEVDHFPTGWITNATTYTPPKWRGDSYNVSVDLPGAYPGDFAGKYRMGFGGGCSILTPPESYWCQPDGRTAGHTYYVRTPSGIQNATALLPHSPYRDAGVGSVVTYWRPGHWFSVMYNVSEAMDDDIVFDYGGFQGAEGHDVGQEWFIENVFEELDSPNEFYYNSTAGLLYLWYNTTTTPPLPPPQVEVPVLEELIVIEGSQEFPVVNVSLFGLEFTGQAPTYLQPHGIPSAGDWGLARIAAVRMKGTERTTIDGCTFHHLDGNAVFLDGYNRWTQVKQPHSGQRSQHTVHISRSEFVQLGSTAIAAWGYEHMGDGTGGAQPRDTQVVDNMCHEIGIYQKQSSCYFQAVSAENVIQRNLFFNGPRAMVNFNDGFGGGHDLGDNLIFNSCRESSDHGAFNSWDRQPYVTLVGGSHAKATAQPAYSRLHNNFIVANYAADGGCFDNDDGSSWYLEENNFCVYGGMKSNFEGHNKRSSNNVHAFASVYGDKCLGGINQISDEYAEGYFNNTCILTSAGDPYIQLSSCSLTAADYHTITHDNIVYAPDGNVTVSCGKELSGGEWLAAGLDAGSVIRDAKDITTADIIALGAAVLQQK